MPRGLGARARPWPQSRSLFVTRVYRAELAGAKADAPQRRTRSRLPVDRARTTTPASDGAPRTAIPATPPMLRSTICPGACPSSASSCKALDAACGGVREGARIRSRRGRSSRSTACGSTSCRPGGMHTSHIHPHSVVSGTYYVAIPEGASAHQVRGSAPRLHDGGPAAQEEGRSREQAVRLYRARSRARCFSGKAGCATRSR